jgi:hypothetical protein
MKNQDQKFIAAREKIKRFIKINNLPISAYSKRKLGRYKTALGFNQALTPLEVSELDTALKSVQSDIQEIRNQLKQSEK